MRVAFVVLILFAFACQQQETTWVLPGRQMELLYADGFDVRIDSIYKWVEVRQPYQGAETGLYYLLVPKGADIPDHPSRYKVIRTPISSIVCTSTTHIPLLDYLGQSHTLVGFPSHNYISSATTRKYVDAGKVADLGIDEGLNIELLATLKPELVMGYTRTSEYGQFRKIEQLGIPVVINAEYLEKHPLGRAEWIRFAGLFFEKQELADSVFTSIVQSYKETASIVTTKSKPTVLSGVQYGDAWFLPGGKNYAATLFNDAGFAYLWSDDPSHGFLELSFESVFAKAKDADFWIGVASYKNLKELGAADDRYTRFKAFQQRMVYSYDARQGPKGGSEYLELGYLRPDIILKDLVKIAHPELLGDYELYFHRRLP